MQGAGHRRHAQHRVPLDGTEQLDGKFGLVDPIEGDRTAGQGMPLLGPVPGAPPDSDHIGQTRAPGLELASRDQESARFGDGEPVHPAVSCGTGDPAARGERLQSLVLGSAGKPAGDLD